MGRRERRASLEWAQAVLALLSLTRTAAAVEIPLPGERALRLNGFYELRLGALGEGAPLGETSLSEFRHVLQLESDLAVLPHGVGPVDGVFFWARSALGYECIFERGCGLFESADSFGGRRREPERLPAFLDTAAAAPRPFVGGLHGRALRIPAGTPRRTAELSPGRALQSCLDAERAPGLLRAAPYGDLCALTRRSGPGGPHRGVPGMDAVSLFGARRVHSGAVALPARFGLLRAARPRIGEARHAELLARLLPDAQGRFSGALTSAEESLRRGLERAGEVGAAQVLRADRFDAAIPELLATRSDASLFGALAGRIEPRLLSTRWGRGRLFDLDVAFTPDLDFPVRPRGYFAAASLDLVSEFAAGGLVALPPTGAISVRGFEQLVGRGNPFIERSELQRAALPFFVGPDGVSGSEDDLPSSRTGVTGLDEPIPATSSFARNPRFAYTRVGKVALDGESVELYAVLEPQQLRRRACAFLTRRPARGDASCHPQEVGLQTEVELERVGCQLLAGEAGLQRAMGFNADGHCVELNVAQPLFAGGVDPRVLVALGERRLRPPEAPLEPIGLTDLRLRAENRSSLPARPSGPGLVFEPRTTARFRRRHRDLVANLAFDFGEDALRWGHGASDDEHEFREGYFELEALDRALTARLGKLIVVWGKTDLFRNQDRWNPLDLSNGPVAPLEELRVGQWGTQLWLQPRGWLEVGPFEDLRLELAWLFDDYEPDDLGRCGEPGAGEIACLLQASAIAAGLTGVGLIGQVSPSSDRDLLQRSDLGLRLEGRVGRFGFALSDFWGWDDQLIPRGVHAYERRVDALTGAPLRAGGRRCRWRASDGRPTDARALSVGPNGIRGDDDDVLPSAGDCLLWGEPDAPGGRQRLRSEREIAALHPVNQTLFHLLCALTFDPDDGFCGLDSWNSPQRFGETMAVLGGGPLEPFAFRRLGLDRIRLRAPAGLGADARARERALLEHELVELGPPALRPVNERANAGADIYAGSGLSPVQRASVGLGGGLLRRDGLGALTVQQAALLGCGPAYASPCNAAEQADYVGAGGSGELGIFEVVPPSGSARFERALPGAGSLVLNAKLAPLAGPALDQPALVAAELGMTPAEFDALVLEEKREILALGQGTLAASLERAPAQLGGGIDFMNADASVLLQESSVLKAWAPGMFVGTRVGARGLEWLPGINTQADGSLANDFQRSAFALPGEREPLSARRALRMSADERFRLAARVFGANHLDGWIEPMPWKLDPEWARRGVILFLADPEHPFGDPTAYRMPESAPDRVARLIGSTRNDFNRLADGTPYGEYCGTLPTMGALEHPFARGCTELEIVSANLERLMQGADIVGPDREFDPPESLAELLRSSAGVLRGGFPDVAAGDPIAGADGIFARNFWADLVLDEPLAGNPEQNDVQDVLAVRGQSAGRGKGTYVAPLGAADLEAPEAERIALRRAFFQRYDPNSCPGAEETCHLKLTLDSATSSARNQGDVELVAALPIAYPVQRVAEDGALGDGLNLNLLELELERPLELARLFAGEHVFDPHSGSFVVMPPAQRARLLGDRGREDGYYQDLDGDGVPDLDRDLDNVWDGQDDFTPGPITDDNVLCGSGIPGDTLQEALQYEPYRRSERPGTPAFAAAFPGGLPPRSPVFCSAARLLGSTATTLPIKRAGGDGRYGRIQFAWHDGRQIALETQKRNTLGFALDFAEDLTRSSWALELSWTPGRALADSRERDLISRTDEWVGSVSVDRSTFLRRLNPGSSFLLNLQVFARYLTDYRGGRDDRDGYYLHTPAPLTALFTASAETSYWQGRLAPRVTWIQLPQESQAGLLTQLTFQWTPALSTTLGMAQFFGRAARARAFSDPIGPGLASPEDVIQASLQRGLTSVLNRDELWFRIRYAW